MIYLDNAATTLQKPSCVGQAMLDALEHAGNPGRGAHEPTLHAARIVYHARETLATLLHAEGPDCIAFTANVTQALNTALCGLVRPGDHVITTVCEHNSVLRPLYRLREQGAELSFVEMDDTGRRRYEQFEKFLRPNTRLVVVTHASNVTGDLTDLAFVSAFAKKHGITLVVDAAQTAGARPIDVQALGVDVLCFTGHKALLGPQGTGGLYVRPGLTMAPLVVGGSGIHSNDIDLSGSLELTAKAGSPNGKALSQKGSELVLDTIKDKLGPGAKVTATDADGKVIGQVPIPRPVEPEESSSSSDGGSATPSASVSSLPGLTVTDKSGAVISYTSTQSGNTLTVCVGRLTASLHVSLAALRQLRAEGIETIAFQTVLCSTTLSVDELLAMGGEDAEAVLTHRLTDSSLTVG